jgi:uncharacterized repeat protein (TIGR01451 family)
VRRILTLLSGVALLVSSTAPVLAITPGTEQAPLDRAADLEPADAVSVSAPGLERKPDLGTGTEPRTYLVRLHDPAIPTYEGGKPGLARTAPRGIERLDPDSPAVRAYRRHLEDAQARTIARIERQLGRSVNVPFSYQYAVNGLAIVLTPDEAHAVAADPAVASIALDVERELHTDAGPQWSGAEAIWQGLGLPEGYRGEGIVIGTIDTGISPGNSSFADPAPGDGYDHTNPLGAGNYLGVCDPDNPTAFGGFDVDFPCNDKLIGAYVFGGLNGNSALDYDGHGSHTASTSGGNVVEDVVVETAAGFVTPPFDISGVAPHANVVSYLGCCSLSGLTAAINQAIADGVDAINYSIGSSAPSQLWDDFDTVGFLNARAAGIFVATSNGNDGPGFATTGSPSDAPWITSVGASTHNRHNGNALINLTGAGTPPADIPGKSVTGSLDELTPIVFAGDFGDPLCGQSTGNEANFAGKIVVCDRGVFGRVEKSENVAAQGAVGYVLINDAIHGDSVQGDQYAVPGVFISFANGQVLKAWLAEPGDHAGMIAGTEFVVDDQYGDIMVSFSSRGPNRAVDVIVPDVTAPGVDVLAAVGAQSYDSDIHGFISGTSMASPHVAGAGALLSQARPGWTPAQIQSALMTTARSTILNHDGQPATPYAEGAGHIDIGAAALAGLLFDETHANYLAANPAEGGDPKTLNLPSFANTQCLVTCSWERTATVPASAPAGVTWSVSTTSDAGLTLDVTLSQATVSPGDSVEIDVVANVAGAPEGETRFARITLTPSNPDVPAVTMPLAVVPTAGVLPGSVDVETRRNAGSYLVTGIESIAISEFTGSVHGLVQPDLDEGSLDQDPTRTDPYDDLAQVDVYNLDVPAGASRLVAETVFAEMPDLDLFVGTGSTPSLATEVCSSTTPTAAEKCDVADPAAGQWWILIQNWAGTEDQPDAYTLASAVVPGEDLGNAGVDGPSGPVPAGEPYDVRIHWDIPDMTAGDRWYGTAVLGSSPATPGDIGSFPVNLVRVEDDVTKTASVASASPSDTVSYEITIQPNVTPEDLVYTITDTVPEGLTIDPGSVTGGGVVDGQTITWEVELPTAAGAIGDYSYTTSLADPSCASPLGGYFDMRSELGFQPSTVEGDIGVFTFLADRGFHFYGDHPLGLGVTPHGFVLHGGEYAGQPWVPQNVPNAQPPNGMVAPLWADTEIVRVAGDIGEERGVTVASNAALAIVEFDRLQMFDSPSQVLGSYQLVTLAEADSAGPDAWIVFDTPGFLPSDYTVGTEHASGTRGTQVSESLADVWVADSTICLNYDGPSFDAVSFGYDVTVDPTPTDVTLTNEAVHVTDDPYAQEAVASFDLEVTGANVESITVSPASAKLKPGDTRQFTATAHLADGTAIDVTDTASWTSGNQNVVTVDAGLATAVGGGKTTITASYGGASDSASVQVTGKPAGKGPGPQVATTTLPDANVFQSYEAPLAAERGTPPYTWAVSSLPRGLELDPSSGLITNDPSDPAITDASSVIVTVTVTDSIGRTAQADLPLNIIGAAQVSTGGGHTCAIDDEGTAYCWGGNFNGQLGVGEGDTTDRALPTPIDATNLDGPVAAISTGSTHTCAVTEPGAAYCWGFNGNGHLGTGDTMPRTIPTPVAASDMGAVSEIATGWQHTCAVDTDGGAYCWGSNFFGQLGNGDPPIERHTPWPVNAAELGSVAHIAAYAGHTCAVNTDAAGFCWGYNGDGQLGNGTTENRRNPTPIDDALLGDVAQLSLSPFHTCAVDIAETAYCWGANANGQLGDGTTEQRSVPTPVVTDQLAIVAQISAGEAHTCAVSPGGEAYCWGYNGNGRLGDGTTATRHVPTAVAADQLGAAAAVSAGGAHTCAVVVNSALWCWGWNELGQLGDGTQDQRLMPGPVHPGP